MQAGEGEERRLAVVATPGEARLRSLESAVHHLEQRERGAGGIGRLPIGPGGL
jgi:hypothetical protein